MPGERVGALSKAELRTEMRRARRAIEDVDERSRLIWARVTALDGLRSARRLMVFTSIPGEPDTSSFIRWCASRDKGIAVPEDEPDPKWPDVVIVPGLAFTVAGERLGQGGPLLVGASTHAPEEQCLLGASTRLRERLPTGFFLLQLFSVIP